MPMPTEKISGTIRRPNIIVTLARRSARNCRNDGNLIAGPREMKLLAAVRSAENRNRIKILPKCSAMRRTHKPAEYFDRGVGSGCRDYDAGYSRAGRNTNNKTV